MTNIEIIEARTDAEIAEVRALFLDYGQSLGFSLCFQGFEEEVANLPGMYSHPEGAIFLARIDGVPIGCAALHKIDTVTGEMKRLYVKPSGRGAGLGRHLSELIILKAREIGYQKLRLDTISDTMQSAVALYVSQGFVDIPPYRHNPIPGARYLELDLTRPIE